VAETRAETALPTLGAVGGSVAREDFPAFITEAGVHGEWASVGVRSSKRVKGVFVGEDTPEQLCRDLSVNESVRGGYEVVMVGVETLLEVSCLNGHLLLSGCSGAVTCDVGG